MAKKRAAEVRSWLVTVKATVKKQLVVNNCTEEEARAEPYNCDVASEEQIDQTDWEVLKVEPNV